MEERGRQQAVGGTPIGPLTPSERIAWIDVLRGLAIFGILLENMLFFGGPSNLLQMDQPWWSSPIDRIVVWAIQWLEQGKFYSLFSFLFGLGMALQMQRIEAHGGRFVRVCVRRLVVLLLIGLCHATLVWWGDILTTYAVLGFVLLAFRIRGDKTLVFWSLVCWLVPVVLVAGVTGLVALVRLFPEGATALEQNVAARQEMLVQLAHYSVASYAHGSYAEILAQRVLDLQQAWIGTAFAAPGIFMMFLLGLWAGRRGLVDDPAEHPRLLRRLLLWGLPLGLLCHLGYVLSLGSGSRSEPSPVQLGGYVLYTLGLPPLTFGYAAAVVLLAGRAGRVGLLAPLAAVGRMSLTNYLVQSLLCTTLFYSYGFGLYGRIGPALGLVPTVLIYTGQVFFSVWWLRRFRFGPLEWLWRSLTYGQIQPMCLAHDEPASAASSGS